MSKKPYEFVNNPNHYTTDNYRVIDIINAFNLNFELGNALKYIIRAGKKPDQSKVQDLQKAIFYLREEIEKENG